MAAGLQNQLRAKYADKRLATCNIAALPNDNMPNNASNGRLLAVFGNSFGCGAVVAAAPSDGAVEFVEAAVGSGIGALGATNKADRKSTRLNSSHDQISYAVFCLKKKKKKKKNSCAMCS